MLSFVRLPLLALAAVLVLGLTACNGDDSGKRTISVTASATVNAVPDLAELDLGVNSDAGTAREALAANNRATRALIAALQRQGIDAKDMQTQNVSVYPRTDANGNQTGFTATNTLHVKIRDVAKAGQIVEAAVGAGGNLVSGPSFSRESSDDLYTQALDKAYDKARAKAEALAEHAGLELGKAVSIQESGEVPGPIFRAEGKGGDAASVPFEPGETEIGATVTVSFELS